MIAHLIRRLWCFVILAFCLVLCAQGTRAQDAVGALTEIDIAQPTLKGCQRNTINIANLRALLATTKERAFIIARLGAGETSRRLNRRRLNDVKTQLGGGKEPEKVILAEGERVQGLGRIEFYLGSEVMFASLLSRNGDFCASCCDRKELFYKNPFRPQRKTGRRR